MRPSFLSASSAWVETSLRSLSLPQKIAQLLHVPSWSNRSEIHIHEMVELIDRYQLGGVIFFQGDPVAQGRATERYQQVSSIPLMISIDAEWGLAMRLEETVQYPYQMALGALKEVELIEEMGAQLARQCRRLGIHVNFAPSVDINTEASNPVIGFRSFGADPAEVSRRAAAYMRGMQDNRVLAVAKHFPGHGDTSVDSHVDLPVLSHAKERLDRIELAPFRHLIQEGIAGVMPGHLHVPAYDEDIRIGATLSSVLVNDLLRKEMGFEGLIFTDALDMKGVSKHFSAAEINCRALLAGNDVMLFCVDVPGSIDAIIRAVEEQRISEEEITRRCRKLLTAKAWLGLSEGFQPPALDQLVDDLHPPEAIQLNQQLAEQSLTLLKGKEFLPLPKGKRIASISVISDYADVSDGLAHHELTRVQLTEVANQPITLFQECLGNNRQIDHFFLDLKEPETMHKWAIKAIREYEWVVVGLHGLHIKAGHHFGLTEILQMRLGAILAESRVILLIFGNAYAVDLLEDIDRAKAVVLAYQETAYTQSAAAKLLLGEIEATGQLPISLKRDIRTARPAVNED
ncbi:MAG: glycoside hydrolase family 3 protein [Bacteroidota bacterium]